MDWTQIASFTFVAALLVMSPGPNGALLAKTVPIFGRRAGLANVAGFVSAFYLHGALSILGVSALLTQSAQVFFAVKMLGAAYLAWIGISALYEAFRGARHSASAPAVRRKSSLRAAFAEGFLTNALNPKVSMFYLAAFPQFIPAGEGAAFAACVLVVVHSALNAVWFGGMVLLLNRMSGAARTEKFKRWMQGITGAVFHRIRRKTGGVAPVNRSAAVFLKPFLRYNRGY